MNGLSTFLQGQKLDTCVLISFQLTLSVSMSISA